MFRLELAVLVVASIVCLCVPATLASNVAVCQLTPTEAGPAGVSGSVTFTWDDENQVTTVAAEISGLERDGDYAMHVHELGDITGTADGVSTGPHYVGAGSATHGCPDDPNRHAGDMGAWTADGGFIASQKTLTYLHLGGPFSIVGRAVVLHEKNDSCTGASGDAGSRIAICTIGVKQPPTGVSNDAHQDKVINNAVCKLVGTSNGQGISGTVWFKQQASGVSVVAQVTGLDKDTPHGFHIHAFGDLSAQDGTSLGGHFNPEGNLHALPPQKPRHQGDLGNIQSYTDDGVAWYKRDEDYLISLSSVIGRGIVIHKINDHGAGYQCDQAGSAGARLAACVIGVAADDLAPPTPPIQINNEFALEDCEKRPPPDTPPDGPSSGGDGGSLVWIIICCILIATNLLTGGVLAFVLYKQRQAQELEPEYDQFA